LRASDVLVGQALRAKPLPQGAVGATPAADRAASRRGASSAAGETGKADCLGGAQKKLGLTLHSEKTDGERVYRVTGKPDGVAEASTSGSGI
jgi:hypothetical protein